VYFIGLDGISIRIYTEEKWSQALTYNFSEIEKYLFNKDSEK